jgi:hypothetical protein
MKNLFCILGFLYTVSAEGSTSREFVEAARDYKSTCINKLLDELRTSGCETIFRQGHGDQINAFACVSTFEQNTATDNSYVAYNRVYWAGYDVKTVNQTVYCQDDQQTIYAQQLFNKKIK